LGQGPVGGNALGAGTVRCWGFQRLAFHGFGFQAIIAGATGDDAQTADNWTPEERRELADYMIWLWQEFKPDDQ
jgi:hypothetical protein